MARRSPFLDLWKDAELEVYVTRKNTTTGALEPATGLTGCEFRIAATEQGPQNLAVAATERTSKPGRYYAVVDINAMASVLTAPLYPHLGDAWVQFYRAGDVVVEAFRKIVRRTQF